MTAEWNRAEIRTTLVFINYAKTEYTCIRFQYIPTQLLLPSDENFLLCSFYIIHDVVKFKTHHLIKISKKGWGSGILQSAHVKNREEEVCQSGPGNDDDDYVGFTEEYLKNIKIWDINRQDVKG